MIFTLLRPLFSRWVVLLLAVLILWNCFLRPQVMAFYWWMRP